jgi:hypothetical protein
VQHGVQCIAFDDLYRHRRLRLHAAGVPLGRVGVFFHQLHTVHLLQVLQRRETGHPAEAAAEIDEDVVRRRPQVVEDLLQVVVGDPFVGAGVAVGALPRYPFPCPADADAVLLFEPVFLQYQQYRVQTIGYVSFDDLVYFAKKHDSPPMIDGNVVRFCAGVRRR